MRGLGRAVVVLLASSSALLTACGSSSSTDQVAGESPSGPSAADVVRAAQTLGFTLTDVEPESDAAVVDAATSRLTEFPGVGTTPDAIWSAHATGRCATTPDVVVVTAPPADSGAAPADLVVVLGASDLAALTTFTLGDGTMSHSGYGTASRPLRCDAPFTPGPGVVTSGP